MTIIILIVINSIVTAGFFNFIIVSHLALLLFPLLCSLSLSLSMLFAIIGINAITILITIFCCSYHHFYCQS